MTNDSPNSYKIIFTGPVASGKTTAITTISGIPTLSTEEKATDETKKIKEDTTVAMDYGMLEISDGNIVHLYGTPGQERFSYMREILIEGGLGLVLLINNKSPSAFDDIDHYINSFKDFIDKTFLVIGVTHMDTKEKPTMNQYYDYLATYHKNYPVFEIDARQERDVKILLQSLLYSLG